MIGERVLLGTAGSERTFRITAPALRREEKGADEREAHEAQKVPRPHIRLPKTVYKYATLTVKRIVELRFISEPRKSECNVSNTAVSALLSREVAKPGSTRRLWSFK